MARKKERKKERKKVMMDRVAAKLKKRTQDKKNEGGLEK